MKIALIGGGNMARGLIGGLLGHGANPDLITVSDPIARAAQRCSATLPSAPRTTTPLPQAMQTWWCWPSSRSR